MATIENIINFLPPLLKATPLTLMLTAIAAIAGLVIGTLVALALLSGKKLLAWPCHLFTFAFRGTPLLVQLYLIYYGLGQILPGTWVRHSVLWPYLRDGIWYAVLALSLNQAAYNAVVIKGAIATVPKGQIEAALSIGMKRWQILRRITLPLAFRSCLPVNQHHGNQCNNRRPEGAEFKTLAYQTKVLEQTLHTAGNRKIQQQNHQQFRQAPHHGRVNIGCKTGKTIGRQFSRSTEKTEQHGNHIGNK